MWLEGIFLEANDKYWGMTHYVGLFGDLNPRFVV